ncbi:MAG: shikimate dehydrogenase [Bacteroidota bacterium]
MALYGLIGKTLRHSFSQKYFSEKFERHNLKDHKYELFELESISEINSLKKNPDLKGFNVTIPYKEEVLSHLKSVEVNAKRIGAVNVIKIVDNQLHGYNTDYFGFRESLKKWLADKSGNLSALVLGTGGASKAVVAALDSLGIKNILISRIRSNQAISYDDLTQRVIQDNKLIVNTTPLGMLPDLESKPKLPYEFITSEHWIYDLVYNPKETLFLKLGKQQGAQIKNGLEMLFLQAEKSWEIWQSKSDL